MKTQQQIQFTKLIIHNITPTYCVEILPQEMKDECAVVKDEMTKEKVPSNVKSKPPILWIQRHSFIMPNETWNHIHVANKLVKGHAMFITI
ncbi:hypothetical protein Bhyg_07550 [Pseudolycoriella hygida]|uniref:Uncharacterized protein n=1 Tax=Pseudolycoriella hygida TaxID=35572 RepID=A0A9Q0S238_9DIPT|nr:hypothetical protein Bhyg_07550 [Pseudolycoriella hygida]